MAIRSRAMLTYAVIKFIAYSLWCFLGLCLLAPAHATLLASAKYGLLRWFLGLGFGLLAAIALGSVPRESVGAIYFGVYVPLRLMEWAIMAALLRRLSVSGLVPSPSPRVWFWVLGGIIVSFASDLASPEGMAGKFCVGRCLC
jgi:hypothetical protein